MDSIPRHPPDPDDEPRRPAWWDLAAFGPAALALALLALFSFVAIRPRAGGPITLEPAATLSLPVEPVRPPQVGLSRKYEPVTPPESASRRGFDAAEAPPKNDLSPRVEPVWPRPGPAIPPRMPGAEEARGEPLPLFVQAIDRDLRERRLLREVEAVNAARKSSAEEIVPPGRAPTPGPGPQRRGGIDGVKDGFAGLADSIEDLFNGGEP